MIAARWRGRCIAARLDVRGVRLAAAVRETANVHRRKTASTLEAAAMMKYNAGGDET